MRAAIFRKGEIVVGEVAEPEPGPCQVLVKTLACGICGTDLHARVHVDKMIDISKYLPGRKPMNLSRDGMTEAYADAYGPTVRVNAVLLGPFLTDISKAWDMEAFGNRAETAIAMKRGGRPEEVVTAALYLASDQANFTTGALLRVDGGSY